jgi:radical SAM superfamily enzyme
MPQEKKEIRIYSWGHERRFNAFSNYLKKLYGARIQEVAVDAGFICPNRDGTKGTGGCTYCNNDAFNPGYCTPDKTVSKQIEEGMNFINGDTEEHIHIWHIFQAYTNTYAGWIHYRSLYEEALSYPGVVGLVIGTRPDCIDD